PQLAEGLVPEEVSVLRSFGGASHMNYLFNPVALASLMSAFAPTHIHIEEDPHSVVGAETVWLASHLCPDVPISFFVWYNLYHVPSFPLRVAARRLTRFSLGRSNKVICGNEEALPLLHLTGYRGRSAVMPQVGLDPPAHREIAERAGACPTVGYFRRLVEGKGLLDLLFA